MPVSAPRHRSFLQGRGIASQLCTPCRQWSAGDVVFQGRVSEQETPARRFYFGELLMIYFLFIYLFFQTKTFKSCWLWFVYQPECESKRVIVPALAGKQWVWPLGATAVHSGRSRILLFGHKRLLCLPFSLARKCHYY